MTGMTIVFIWHSCKYIDARYRLHKGNSDDMIEREIKESHKLWVWVINNLLRKAT